MAKQMPHHPDNLIWNQSPYSPGQMPDLPSPSTPLAKPPPPMGHMHVDDIDPDQPGRCRIVGPSPQPPRPPDWPPQPISRK